MLRDLKEDFPIIGKPSKKQLQKQAVEYQEKIVRISDEIIKILLDEDFKVIDFNNVIEFINTKINSSLVQTEFRSIVNKVEEEKSNQGNSE